MKNGWVLALAAAVLGAGLGLAGWFVGNGFVEARTGDRFVTVKGVAERAVKADLALWPMRFVATGNDLTAVQGKIAADTRTVTDFLARAGTVNEEIELQGLEVTDLLAQAYRSGPVESRFIVAQTLLVRSQDVDRIKAASQRIGELVSAGVVLSNDMMPVGGPYYVFTGLSQIKPGMIAEATRNARAGAEQFAADSGSTVGGIRRANQGVFQILAQNDTPGLDEAKQIQKTVRVVSTLDFHLTD